VLLLKVQAERVQPIAAIPAYLPLRNSIDATPSSLLCSLVMMTENVNAIIKEMKFYIQMAQALTPHFSLYSK
jgi:hypothetical protein